jgi:hypothetical protein
MFDRGAGDRIRAGSRIFTSPIRSDCLRSPLRLVTKLRFWCLFGKESTNREWSVWVWNMANSSADKEIDISTLRHVARQHVLLCNVLLNDHSLSITCCAVTEINQHYFCLQFREQKTCFPPQDASQRQGTAKRSHIDNARFIVTYFTEFSNQYLTYWLTDWLKN